MKTKLVTQLINCISTYLWICLWLSDGPLFPLPTTVATCLFSVLRTYHDSYLIKALVSFSLSLIWLTASLLELSVQISSSKRSFTWPANFSLSWSYCNFLQSPGHSLILFFSVIWLLSFFFKQNLRTLETQIFLAWAVFVQYM